MSTKAERGTKRTCQNPECGSRFYDLNRDPIICPICQSVFQPHITPAEAAAAAAASQEAARAAARRPEPADLPTAEDEDALPAIEGEDETEAGEEDETFLEPEEEDGSDMENIIGGPVAETDEPQ
jgi:uncharacterized protein (TIGR02300 family)